MKGNNIQDILSISQTFASGKRLLLLFMLKTQPMGYTSIVKSFQNMSIPIGSSEIYKHLNHLLKEGFISKSTKMYILTLRGFRTVENTIDIMETPATVPEVTLSFRKRND